MYTAGLMFIPASNWPPPLGRSVWLAVALAVGLFVAACLSAAAHAQTPSDAFAAGRAAFEQADYMRALAYFENARDAGIDGPAVHFNIAVCLYRLEDYPEAADAFRHLADTYPAMRELALYNLGLVRLRQGRDTEARDLFAGVRDESADETLVALAGEALRRLTPATPVSAPSVWISFLDVGLGYDDNVALIDEASLPATQSAESAFTEFLGVLTGPRGTASGFRFDGTLYAVRHNDTPEYDQAALRAAGLYQWTAGQWRLETGPHLNYSTLNGHGFEQSLGIDLTARRRLSGTLRLSLRALHDEVEGADSTFAYLDGTRQRLSAWLDLYASTGWLSAGLDLERNDREAAGVSPTRNRIWVGYRHTAAMRWTAEAQLALRLSNYDDLTIPREEDLVDITVGYMRRFDRGWELGGRYRWSDNDTDVAPYAYSRSRLSLEVTKNF